MIDQERDLDEVADALEGAERIAIDTESNSLHVYKEQVCFIQIAVDDRVFLLDTLALDGIDILREALEDDDAEKLLHGADYDVVCMKRDFDIGIEPIFDTMIAAQILGYAQLGLGALVERHCNVTLEKAHARHDWGKRPLDDRYIPYLVDDVLYLPELQDALEAELERTDRFEEAGIEFERVAAQTWSGRDTLDPEAFRRIKGARELDQTGLSILKELNAMRDEVARAANVPAFRILGNAQLLAVARERPHTQRELKDIRGFTDRVLRRLGRQVLAATKRGEANRQNVPKRPPRHGERPPEIQLMVEEGLRQWRRSVVQEDDLPPIVVLPNHALERIARERPESRTDLAKIQGLGKKRVRLYGDDILDVVDDPPPLPRRRRD